MSEWEPYRPNQEAPPDDGWEPFNQGAPQETGSVQETGQEGSGFTLNPERRELLLNEAKRRGLDLTVPANPNADTSWNAKDAAIGAADALSVMGRGETVDFAAGTAGIANIIGRIFGYGDGLDAAKSAELVQNIQKSFGGTTQPFTKQGEKLLQNVGEGLGADVAKAGEWWEEKVSDPIAESGVPGSALLATAADIAPTAAAYLVPMFGSKFKHLKKVSKLVESTDNLDDIVTGLKKLNMNDEAIGKIVTAEAKVIAQRQKDAAKAGTFLTKGEALGNTRMQMTEKGLLESSAKGTEGMKSAKVGQTEGIKEGLTTGEVDVAETGTKIQKAGAVKEARDAKLRRGHYNRSKRAAKEVGEIKIYDKDIKAAILPPNELRDLLIRNEEGGRKLEKALQTYGLAAPPKKKVKGKLVTDPDFKAEPLTIQNQDTFNKLINGIAKDDQTGAMKVAVGPISSALRKEVDSLAGGVTIGKSDAVTKLPPKENIYGKQVEVYHGDRTGGVKDRLETSKDTLSTLSFFASKDSAKSWARGKGKVYKSTIDVGDMFDYRDIKDANILAEHLHKNKSNGDSYDEIFKNIKKGQSSTIERDTQFLKDNYSTYTTNEMDSDAIHLLNKSSQKVEALDPKAFDYKTTLTEDIKTPLRTAQKLTAKEKVEYGAKTLTHKIMHTKKNSSEMITEASKVYDTMIKAPVEQLEKTMATMEGAGFRGKDAIQAIEDNTTYDILESSFDAKRTVTPKDSVEKVKLIDPYKFADKLDTIGEKRLKVIYRNSPDKLEALMDARRTMESLKMDVGKISPSNVAGAFAVRITLLSLNRIFPFATLGYFVGSEAMGPIAAAAKTKKAIGKATKAKLKVRSAAKTRYPALAMAIANKHLLERGKDE